MKLGKDDSGFKHSLLGLIPKNWEMKSFGDELEGFSSGSTPTRTRPDFFSGEILWITSGELNYNVIHDTKEKITLEAVKSTNLKLLKPGTFLMAITGLEAEGTRGSCAIVGKEATTNQSCMALIPKPGLDLKFFFHYYSFYGNQFAFKYCQGTKQQSYNSVTASMLPLILPPLTEQKRISKLLTTWDDAIAKTNQLITQKELRKKWLMHQLLTGRKRLKGFSDDWKKYTYGSLLKVVKRSVKWNENELYKLISVRRRSGGIFLRESLYGHQILVKDLRTAEEGDFLFSKMQILHGASALVNKEFAGAKISGSYIAVNAIDRKILNMEFLNWASKLKSFYHQTYISSYGVHIEKMTFDFESFLSLEIKLPSLEEQNAIVQLLFTSDKEIQLLKSKVEKMKDQKKGLMQVLLTGGKRL